MMKFYKSNAIKCITSVYNSTMICFNPLFQEMIGECQGKFGLVTCLLKFCSNRINANRKKELI